MTMSDEFDGDLGDCQQLGEVRFDPWLEAVGPTVVSIVDSVFELTEKLRPSLTRRPRADATTRRRRIVGTVIANLVAAELSGTPSVSISTTKSAFTRYDRRDYPRAAVARALADLADLGLILHTSGVHRLMTSVVEATDGFRSLVTSFGPFTTSELALAPGGETIILRAPTLHIGRRAERGPLIDYDDTSETTRIRREMTAINEFLNNADVTLDGETVAPFRLTRRFQTAGPEAAPSFNLHGRLYDGFWINMHKDERYRIRIGGEVLTDLDFESAFTSISYAIVGHPLPEGDPYGGIEGLELEKIVEPQDRARSRAAIKRGVNAMFFRHGPMSRLPREVKAVLGSDWTADRFTRALRQRHAPIAHLFETGIGLKLMYMESRIMVRFLLDLIDQGIPALPIHDGALVATSLQNRALDSMREASRSVLGVALPVKASPLPRPTLPHH